MSGIVKDSWPTVCIIHRIIAPYRVEFYEKLKFSLAEDGIELKVVYGEPRPSESDPFTDLAFGIKLKTRYFYIGSRFLVWLPALSYALNSDLVVVQQANTNLINYVLLLYRHVRGLKLAFWGHGKNFQASSLSFGEAFKRLYSTRVDHWFAYTNMSKQFLANIGFPEQNISAINNSINTISLIKQYDDISAVDVDSFRAKHNFGVSDPVGIFCSRVYKDKRIDFMLNCLTSIKEAIPEFKFIVIGEGEDDYKIREYAKDNNDWFLWLGSLYGREKALAFKAAHFQIMPGLVGLHVVDSFALKTPLITTKYKYHSPEIIYLENGVNGIMSEDDEASFTKAIMEVINDDTILDKLIQGCEASRDMYTLDKMVANFKNGILKTLRSGDL